MVESRKKMVLYVANNVTNVMFVDVSFSDLKNKLRNHNGLSKVRKIKFIDGFFKA